MGRYSLRLRNIYDENEPTGAESLSRGIGNALGAYVNYQEKGRQERNTVGQAGGEILPDDPANTPSGRWGRIKRGIGSLLGHQTGTSEQRDGLTPEYTDIGGFTQRVPQMPPMAMDGGGIMGTYTGAPEHRAGTAWDERIPAGGYGRGPGVAAALDQPGEYGNFGQHDNDAPLPEQQPQRASGVAAALGHGMNDQESYVYEGQGGMRARMPNVRGQARIAMETKNMDRDADRERQIQSLIDAGMEPREARARVLNNVVRYDETFGQQRGGAAGGRGGMTQEERLQIQDRMDARTARAQQLQRELAGLRSGDSRRRMEITQELAKNRSEQSAEDLILRGQQADATSARNTAARIAADPVAANTPGGKQTIAQERARADSIAVDVNQQRERVRNSRAPKMPGVSGGSSTSQPPAPAAGVKRTISQAQYDQARAAGHSDADIAKSYSIPATVRRKP